MTSENCRCFNEAISALGTKGSMLFTSLSDREKSDSFEVRLRLGAMPQLVMPSGVKTVRASEVTRDLMDEMILCLCGHSVYSHQNEMASGYISIPGGHRAGVCGMAVVEGGKVAAVRNVTSICLRIARKHTGCSVPLARALFGSGICSAVIVGPPCSGKTTLLRDLACVLSEGNDERKMRVAVVDERGELSMKSGMNERDRLLRCCDVLSGYPKAEGVMQALRGLSPDVIICDEIGSGEDIEAVRSGADSGVSMICSIHAGSVQELMRRENAAKLCKDGSFRKIALLSGRRTPGVIDSVISLEDAYEMGSRNVGDNLFRNGRCSTGGQAEKEIRTAQGDQGIHFSNDLRNKVWSCASGRDHMLSELQG